MPSHMSDRNRNNKLSTSSWQQAKGLATKSKDIRSVDAEESGCLNRTKVRPYQVVTNNLRGLHAEPAVLANTRRSESW